MADKTTFIELGTAIATRRQSIGLSQRTLAQYAGCSAPFIIHLEAGKATTRLDKLIDVLQVLGLELHLQAGNGGITFGVD